MFGGIVECIGLITHIKAENGCKTFTLQPAMPFDDLQIGDSVSVSGVCLTVTQFTAIDFQVTVVPETLRVTNLDALAVNQYVNLERALKANQRIGGHYVQGHVDAVGHILDIKQDEKSQAQLVTISVPAELMLYVIKKGFIGIDGMSITVIEAGKDWLTVTFIPHTQIATIVQHYKIKQAINIEVDMMAKYIEKIMEAKQSC